MRRGLEHPMRLSRAWLEVFAMWAPSYKRLIDGKASHHDAALQKLFVKHMRAITKFGKTQIIQGVRARYTYKGSIQKYIKTSVSAGGNSAKLVVRSGRLGIDKFKFKAPGRGRYLTTEVVKGQTSTHRRGFRWRSFMMQRVGQPRLPIKRIMGPSVAEMAGHEPEPARKIVRALELKNLELLRQMMQQFLDSFGF